MKTINRTILILIAAISFNSCENVVDIDVPERPPKLVLNAYISPDSLWHISLSHSKYVLDNRDYKEISNAEISVHENGELKENLNYQVINDQYENERGFYKSNFHRPQAGNVYRVEASMNGYETIWAETTIPTLVTIEQFLIDTSKIISRDYESGYKLSIAFNDPAEIRNYYQVELIARTIRAETYTVYDEEYSSKDTTVYYNNTSSIYITPLNPAIYDDQFGYNNTVIFSDGIFNGSLFYFDFLVDEWYISPFIKQSSNENEETSLEIVLRSINEEMYLYETTADLQDWNSGNPFAEPVPVFSNINNGYGVFGAFAADSSIIRLKK